MSADSKIKLVIVDDHTLFREGIKKILSLEKDIEIVGEAFDGEEVISFLNRCEPDIMLLDVKMERVNGLQVLPRIVEQFPLLKVIILTAQVSLGRERQGHSRRGSRNYSEARRQRVSHQRNSQGC